MNEKEKETQNNPQKIHIFLLLFIVPCIFYILLMNKTFKQKLLSSIKYIKKSEYGKIYFIVFIVFINIIFLNNTFSNILSGYIFGFKNGIIITILGNILSSILSFYISKYYINDKIKTIVYESPYLKDFKDLIIYENSLNFYEWFELVLLSRISPLYSYQIISYYWGITDVPLHIFIMGTLIGSLPMCIFDTYIGSLIKNTDSLFKTDIKTFIMNILLFLLLMIFSSYKIHNIIEHIK